MYDCMIVLRSASAAQRAVRILSEHGIPGVTARPPAALAGQSCAHGVKFHRRFLPQAQLLFHQAALPDLGAYELPEGSRITLGP